MQHDDEDDLFRQQMGDVSPLADNQRLYLRPSRQPSASQLATRAAAIRSQGSTRGGLSMPDDIAMVDPADIVGEKKNGVQEGVFRKLRLGKYEIQSRLDLHRLTIREAHQQVERFLKDAVGAGLRTVLITHGKGHHSESPGKMKSYTLFWLTESEQVMAWHSAQPQHGGAGATYVLLRKSVEAKQRTREFFSQGR